MEIYSILILLSFGALVSIAWVLIQRLNARYRRIEDGTAFIKNALEKLSAQIEFYANSDKSPSAPSIEAPADMKVMGDVLSKLIAEIDKREQELSQQLENARLSAIDGIDQARQDVLESIDQSRVALLAEMGEERAVQTSRVPAEESDVVSRVEMTLREIQEIALEMKDASNSGVPVADDGDARAWTLINSLRSDATEAREAIERSQKRMRQLGDCMEDAMRKLRALDRRIKQAKRQSVQALPAPEPDEMDMKL